MAEKDEKGHKGNEGVEKGKKIKFRFQGWGPRFDEWVYVSDDRIAPLNLYTNPESKTAREQEKWQGKSKVADEYQTKKSKSRQEQEIGKSKGKGKGKRGASSSSSASGSGSGGHHEKKGGGGAGSRKKKAKTQKVDWGSVIY